METQLKDLHSVEKCCSDIILVFNMYEDMASGEIHCHSIAGPLCSSYCIKYGSLVIQRQNHFLI